MFDILFTDEALAIYKDLEDKAEKKSNKKITKNSLTVGLLKQIKKTLNFLIRNPRHPGLHTHEYSGLKNPWDFKQKVFEAYVQNRIPEAYRLFWCYGSEGLMK
jgi:hypothetical protein